MRMIENLFYGNVFVCVRSFFVPIFLKVMMITQQQFIDQIYMSMCITHILQLKKKGCLK